MFSYGVQITHHREILLAAIAMMRVSEPEDSDLLLTILKEV